MSDSPVVGSASFELRARRDQLKKDLADAERDLKQSTGQMEAEAEKSVGRATGKIGGLVRVLSGVLVSAAGGAFALGVASLKMAQDMADSARRIGVTTDALQEFRYVARQTGEDVQSVDGALERFASRLNGAAAGLDKDGIKLFRSIGLEPEDLRRFKSTEDALDNVLDRITALRDPNDRVALAEKLGLDPLTEALREGRDALDEYRDGAHEAGQVMDRELIAKGADAAERLDDLSKVVSIQMAEAFVQLTDEILSFTSALAESLGFLNRLIERFDTWKSRANAMYGDDFTTEVASGNSGQALISAVRSVVTGRTTRAARSIRDGESIPDFQPVTADDLRLLARPPRAPRAPDEDYQSRLTLPPGRTPRPDRSAERAAEREARRAERVEQEIFRAKQRLLDVADGDLLTAQERWDLAVDQLELQRQARDAEIASKVTRGEIKEAEATELRLANEQADLLEDRILTDRSLLEIRDEELASARLLADLTADLLSLQSGSARTARERERIELELLEITQKQRRDALDQELNKRADLTDADRQRIWDQQGRVDQAEREAVARRNMSPLEQWRDESLKTADEISEAYERVAANGLEALNDGLVDAIMNSRSLGDVFSNVARQILADLLKISVRRGIVEPLANALFPGGEGGSQAGGGSIFSFLRSLLPRRASGDASWMGGAGVFNELGGEFMTLPNGTQIIPHDVSMRMAAGAGDRRRGGDTYLFEGNMMTPEFWAKIRGDIAAGKAQAIGQSVRLARKGSAAQQQRLARLGTP